jgi:uncharacterized delta-60 repeat protein
MKKSFVQKGGAFAIALILILTLTHIQAQQLDPNFKPSVEWSYGKVFDFEMQSDGKIILAGDFQIFDNLAQQYLVRINPDGTPDPSFNTGAGPNQRIVDIVLQPDGKLLVLGPFTTFDNQPAKDLVRLNSDGSIDATFDTGTGFDASPYAFAIQPDGEILVTGPFTSYRGASRNHLIRLHSDGSLDTGFDIGAGLSGGVSYIIAIQPDNKIVLGGGFTQVNGLTKGGICRFNADGSMDNTFTATGMGPTSGVYDIEILASGKILVGGGFASFNGVTKANMVRLNSDGATDDTFVAAADGLISQMVVMPDNSIFIIGSFSIIDGASTGSYARVTPDGALMNNFALKQGPFIFRAMANDSKLIVSTSATVYKLSRLNADGTLDGLFSQNAIFKNAGGVISSMQRSGKIIIGGQMLYLNGAEKKFLARLTPDGKPDNTFNIGTGPNSTISSIVIQPDDKILLGGLFMTFHDQSAMRILRLNSDGSTDQSFVSPPSDFGSIYSMALQNDGKIIVSGLFPWQYKGATVSNIFRLNADGSLDQSFNVGQGPNSVVNISLIQPDGKIVAFGDFSLWDGNPASRVVRLNTDGSLDTSFTPGSGFDNSTTTAALTPDNKIMVGGYFQSFNGVPVPYLTRLNPSGMRDTSFNPILPGTLNPVSSLVVRSDGKVMVGKRKYPFAGDYPTYFFQVNPDGSPDPDFLFQGPNQGVDYILNGIDESIIVSGGFNSVNGVPRIGMFAILPSLPAPPDVLTIASDGTHSIELAWNDNSGNEIGFVIQRSAETPISFTSVDTTFANVVSFKDRNLTPGTSYLYRVASFNRAGSSSFSNTATVSTIPFPAPSSLTAEYKSNGTFVLSWIDNTTGEDKFIVERSYSGDLNQFGVVDSVGANITTLTLPLISNQFQYYYRVKAANAEGFSPYSNTAHVDITTGLKENNRSSAFVWKNAQTGEFTVHTNWNNGFDLVVTDIMGRPVYSAISQDNQFRFQLLAPSGGIYILRIVSQDKIASMRILN